MVKLKKISFKNFISYGNQATEYNFETGVSRISGINGKGKSAVVDAIYYSMFGKSFRKTNIPKMINSINKKDLRVELFFDVKGKDYKIIRGLRPEIFEIYKNDVLIDQAATKKSYQSFLEEDIFQFDEDIFQQIGIKSLTRYDSFLTLSKGKKRTIIENIFGIEILSEMKELNKIEMDDSKVLMKDLKKDQDNFKLLQEQEKFNIQKLKAIQKQLNEEVEELNKQKLLEVGKLEKNQLSIKEGLKKIREYRNLIGEHLLTISNCKASIKQTVNEFVELGNIISAFENNIHFIKTQCGECPNIGTLENDSDIEQDKIQYSKLESSRKKIIDQQNELEDEIDSITEKFISKNDVLLTKLNNLKQEIKKIKLSISPPKEVVQIDYTKFDGYTEKIKILEKQIQDEAEKIEYNKAINMILQDDGIKAYIIKRYLPLINKLMNTYLQKFSINLEMEFTPEMDIEIKTKFKEGYSYESFSEGEKRRINASLMFTFLEFCKLKHSNASINILILDEFSSGLDPIGENTLYDILKDMVEKEGKEVITISHSPLIDPEKISRVYHVDMERGFSKLERIEN